MEVFKGEQQNALRRVVFFNRLAEIRGSFLRTSGTERAA
jgi:hypothetical protein